MAEAKKVKVELVRDGVFYPEDVRHELGAILEVPEDVADELMDKGLANLPRPKRRAEA